LLLLLLFVVRCVLRGAVGVVNGACALVLS
jgi:hypothetical protein